LIVSVLTYPKEATKKETSATVVKDYKEWIFEPKKFDWFDTNTGESLTKFHPLFKLIALLELNVDTQME
jgi:hypothetical protein